MLKKLAPLMFQENGQAVPPATAFEQIDFGNIALAAHEKGRHIEIGLAAQDPDGPVILAHFSAKAKKRAGDE